MARGNRRVLLHAPTGAGKTATSSEIALRATRLGKRVLFLANRRELIHQAEKTLSSFGIECGIIMAGVVPKHDAQVQIASMQTYIRRMNLEKLMFNRWWHNADLIIVDEAHGSISPSFQKILDEYDDKYILGLTATPCRGDGRGLGEYYDDIVSTIGISDLINQGFLVTPRYFAASAPNLDGIKTVSGDYKKKELGERVNDPKLIGDIYTNWSIICPDRPTIIFATNVKHSLSILEAFSRNGIEIAHINAKTPKEERDTTLERLKSGHLQVITNVGILCEGFDFPKASCIAIARPTKSLGLYVQMGGRGLRTADGKSDCIILDFARCIENHGLLEWDREWSLDGKKKAWGVSRKNKVEKKKTLKCSGCNAVFESGSRCPDCGTELHSFGKSPEVLEGELEEVKKGKPTVTEKRIYLGMLKFWVNDKGHNPKMVIAKYIDRYGVWPHRSIADVSPIQPDQAFINRMKYEQIAYSKRRKSA
jgi:superfamily II DNA or RNA helicase